MKWVLKWIISSIIFLFLEVSLKYPIKISEDFEEWGFCCEGHLSGGEFLNPEPFNELMIIVYVYI